MSKDKGDIKGGKIVRVTSARIQKLKREALISPLKRARICLHQDPDGPVQEMVIALTKASYIKPHKHIDREESLNVIQGKLCLVIFNSKGVITEKIMLGGRRSPRIHLCRLRKNIWHAMVPLTRFVVYHELIQGQCARGKRLTVASWCPDDKDQAGIKSFLIKISRRMS